MLKRWRRARWISLAMVLGWAAIATASQRSEKQQEYSEQLWTYVTSQPYTSWSTADAPAELPFAPPAGETAKSFVNAKARSGGETLPYGSMIVTEHYADGDAPVAVTVCLRAREGFSERTQDWYWAHYLPDGSVMKTVADKDPYAKRGFVTQLDEEGRLWVFQVDSPELGDFAAKGELAKHVIRPVAGPEGKTLKSPDAQTIDAYLAAADGFTTLIEDGRIWVFKGGAPELAEFLEKGELAKHVIRPAAGPQGMTVKSPDAETIKQYAATAVGFTTLLEDDRIWVFKDGAEELEDFKSQGELAKHVIRPVAGPLGMTLKAPDAETIEAYLQAKGL